MLRVRPEERASISVIAKVSRKLSKIELKIPFFVYPRNRNEERVIYLLEEARDVACVKSWRSFANAIDKYIKRIAVAFILVLFERI